MAIVADAITYKKLVLVRQLYDDALIRSHSVHNNVDMIMAVVGFDLAIETTLKAIFSSLETSKALETEFQPLIQKTENLMNDKNLNPLPDKAKIQYIHNIRNDAQHRAKYPNPSDVSDCRTYARDFLQNIIKQVWDFEFDKISLAETIGDDEIKTHLIKAESSLKAKDTKSALKEATIGFNKSIRHVSASVVGRTSLLSSFSYGLVIQDKMGNQKVDEDSYHALQRMKETLQSFALGINRIDYNKYKKITGGIVEVGNNVLWMNEPKDVSYDDADFVVTFAVNNIVKIESMVGDLKKPFGSDNWYWI